MGFLVEEEEISVSKISRREKGGVSFVRSFVSDCNAVETDCQITCLGSLADIGEPFNERCLVTSLQRLFRRLKPEVFFGVTPIVGRKKSCPCGRHRISVLLQEKGRHSPCARTAHNANITSSPSSTPPRKSFPNPISKRKPRPSSPMSHSQNPNISPPSRKTQCKRN